MRNPSDWRNHLEQLSKNGVEWACDALAQVESLESERTARSVSGTGTAKHIHELDQIAMTLTSRLCGIATVAEKDGYELIRRESVMDFVTRWRREWDALKAANPVNRAGVSEVERNLAESWGRWHDYKFASTFRDIVCRTLDKAELYAKQGKPLPQDEIDAMTARLVEATEQLDSIGRPVKPHRSGGGESPGVGTAPK